MRISIVVPAHNNADDLLLCLSALERATPADAEILGVDDASTDDTASRAAAHGIRVLRRSQNGGPSAARNDGALAAGGDIVLFVDADVVVAPTRSIASGRPSPRIRSWPRSLAPTTRARAIPE